jgi:membrane-associated phospholipid phosphatase
MSEPRLPATTAGQPVLWRALLLTGLVGGTVFAVLVAAGTFVYDQIAESGALAALDEPVLAWMVAVRTPPGPQVVTAFTNLGSTVPMVLIGLVLTTVLFAATRAWTTWVLMLVAAAGSVTFTLVGKPAFGRARPPLASAVPPYEQGFSLPSGHTLNSTVVAGMLAYLTVVLVSRTWVRVAAALAATAWSVAMGLSRVYLGHHWLSDVVFAWLVGTAWLALLITVHQAMLERRRNALEHRSASLASADFRSPPALP